MSVRGLDTGASAPETGFHFGLPRRRIDLSIPCLSGSPIGSRETRRSLLHEDCHLLRRQTECVLRSRTLVAVRSGRDRRGGRLHSVEQHLLVVDGVPACGGLLDLASIPDPGSIPSESRSGDQEHD